MPLQLETLEWVTIFQELFEIFLGNLCNIFEQLTFFQVKKRQIFC